jgi:rhodanese-related sulfurtransferase
MIWSTPRPARTSRWTAPTGWGTDAVAPRPVARDDVQRLVAEGAQLVEVLPADEYDEEHLPGAIHLPLKHLTREAAEAALDRARPVVVYCWDAL